MMGGVVDVTHLITGHQHIQLNRFVVFFHWCVPFFSNRTIQILLIFTAARAVPCGGCKSLPVQHNIEEYSLCPLRSLGP